MAKRRKSTNPIIKHVRIHDWEMNTDAWRSMSTDGRALLIEFRSLFKGAENRVFLSVRQMMDRINVGQRRAENARNELISRGWIRVIQCGSFTRKVRHATVYALTNEPINAGEVAPKDFMRYSTVAVVNTNGSRGEYREPIVTPDKPQVGSRGEYRKSPKSPVHGRRDGYTGSLPREVVK